MTKVFVSKELLQQRIEQRICLRKVAEELKCSNWRIEKACREYGLSFQNTKRNKYDDTRGKVLANYRANAKKARREFALTDDQFFEIVQRPCRYCGRSETGIMLVSEHDCLPEDRPPFKYTGVDRLDNEKGYTLANSVPCCEMCNKAKRDLTEEEFKAWIQALIIFNKKEQC